MSIFTNYIKFVFISKRVAVNVGAMRVEVGNRMKGMVYTSGSHLIWLQDPPSLLNNKP